ncbi:preprotein translocase subunit YajC [Actinotalea sp. C106]|uniref:preprotein translocase subunit YajC n=1 Tax=Actinotalea sp. C106 TaxID=2908644 RepID=UPI0020285FCF|nr:preprotein translocase subunit YajC [Actinotalea sp. C106]
MELVIILALFLGAMWLMTSRSRKQQKAAADFRANLAPGQEVMTGSGLFGTIVAVEDDVVTLEIGEGITTRWLRPAIAKLVEPPVDDELDEDEELEDEELGDDELGDDEYEDGEYDDDLEDEDLPEDEASVDQVDQDETVLEVPDDASSLTSPRDEDDKPLR